MTAAEGDGGLRTGSGGSSPSMPVVRTVVSAFDTMATTALVTSGLVAFGTSIILLVAGRASATAVDGATIGLLLAAWIAAFAIRSTRPRGAVQSAIGMLLLASPLLIGGASGGPWMSVTTVGFAVIIGATFTLSAPVALGAIALVAGIESWVIAVAPPAAAFTVGEPLGGYIGPLLAIVAGSGLVLAHASLLGVARGADARQAELERTGERTEREVRLLRAQESVERRVHETVLNTLSGIAMGNIAADAARRAATRDLEQLALGIEPLGDTPLRTLIDTALTTSGIRGVDVTISVADDNLLPASIATALRDAVVEALRNVARHARAGRVDITVKGTGPYRVDIVDDGIGMSPEARERFGIRSALRRSIESVGGAVEIDSRESEGTRVSLIVPDLAPLVPPPPLPDSGSLIDSSRRARLGLAGTSVFLAIVAVPLALSFEASGVIASAMLCFAALNIALAILWTPALRLFAPILGMALVAIVVLAASLGQPTGAIECTVAPTVPWVISALSGGGTLLLLICYPRLVARIAVLLAAGGLSLALTLSVEAACRDFAVLAVLVNMGYMAAIVGYLTWLDIRFDVSRERSLGLWQQITAADADLRASQDATLRWNRLTAGVGSLLRGIAEGTLAPDDPTVRAQAATEGSSLRARLGADHGANRAWDDLVFMATAAALEGGTALETTVVDPWTCPDPMPGWVGSLVARAVERSAPGPVRLVALTDGGYDEALLSPSHPEIVARALEEVPGDAGPWEVSAEDGSSVLAVRRRVRG